MFPNVFAFDKMDGWAYDTQSDVSQWFESEETQTIRYKDGIEYTFRPTLQWDGKKEKWSTKFEITNKGEPLKGSKQAKAEKILKKFGGQGGTPDTLEAFLDGKYRSPHQGPVRPEHLEHFVNGLAEAVDAEFKSMRRSVESYISKSKAC